MKKFTKPPIYFTKPNNGRLFSDALDTYNWLATKNTKIAEEFWKKAIFAEKKLDKGIASYDIWNLRQEIKPEDFEKKFEEIKPKKFKFLWWK